MSHKFSLIRLIPNLITILALMTGLFSIYRAFVLDWYGSVLCICASGILDVLDGRLARLLKVTSSLGIELDSLSDLISFGVSPAIVLYLWLVRYNYNKLVIWASITFYIACSAIRLAKFNILSHQFNNNYPSFLKSFFLGVPVPIGGIYVLLPIIFHSISWCGNFFLLYDGYLCCVYIVLVGIMLTSNVPTFSFKALLVKREYIGIILVMFIFLFGLFVLYTYHFIFYFMILYTLSIGLSVYFFYRKKPQTR